MEYKKLVPLSDKILVTPITLSDTIEELGLVRAASTIKDHKSQWGKVVSVPPLSDDFKGQVKAGDIIMFERVRTTTVEHEDKTYILVRLDNVDLIEETRAVKTAEQIMQEHMGNNIPEFIITAMEQYKNQFI